MYVEQMLIVGFLMSQKFKLIIVNGDFYDGKIGFCYVLLDQYSIISYLYSFAVISGG